MAYRVRTNQAQYILWFRGSWASWSYVSISDLKTLLWIKSPTSTPSWVIIAGSKAFWTDTTKRNLLNSSAAFWNLTVIPWTLWIWRLPTLSELQSIYKNKSSLWLTLQSDRYRSTTYIDDGGGYASSCRRVNMSNGSTNDVRLDSTNYTLCIYD
jgi:hypothetical protein